MFKLTLHVIHIAMVVIQTQHDLYESMMNNLPLGEIELRRITRLNPSVQCVNQWTYRISRSLHAGVAKIWSKQLFWNDCVGQ